MTERIRAQFDASDAVPQDSRFGAVGISRGANPSQRVKTLGKEQRATAVADCREVVGKTFVVIGVAAPQLPILTRTAMPHLNQPPAFIIRVFYA